MSEILKERCVGVSVVRVDAADKLTGKIKYAGDYYNDEYLHGKTLRSPYPCALIKKISYGADFDWSAVTVVTEDDIPGENVLNNFNMDVPFLAKNGKVNYVGEPVLLVAAESEDKAEEALKHIFIDYEIIEPSLNVFDSLAGKNLIYNDDNIIKEYNVIKGDASAVFENYDNVFEGVYKTPYQEQAYIEPQVMIAVPSENGVTIYGSMQCPYYVRKESLKLFDFPPENIHVVQTPTGGGFGGKEHFPSIIASHAALLAIKAKKPVKMAYDRVEDMEGTTKRHPSIIRVKTAVSDKGKLLAVESDIIFDAGAYSMASPVVLARAAIAGAGAYNCDNVKIRARAVATNLIPTSAFRGFGAPQIFFAIERHMTRQALKLGLDPVEFKRANLLKQGDVTATGQLLKEPVGLEKCIGALFEKFNYSSLYSEYLNQPFNLKKRRGVGFSAVFHGAGFTGKGEDYIKAKAGVRISPEGTIEVLCGTTEMGQGMRTVLPQIVAETMKVPFSLVSVAETDTDDVPDSGPTVASRTTMIVGKVLKDAASDAYEALIQALKEEYGENDIKMENGAFKVGAEKTVDLKEAAAVLKSQNKPNVYYSQYSSPPGVVWDERKFHGDAYAGYAWAATACEVEVDMETYEVSVLRLVSACDVGKAINPILAEGQIEGGCIQALGYALMEDIVMKNGKIQNNRFATYIIPTAADVPLVEAVLVEEPYSNGPYGAKGLGEMPCVVVAPCVADAVAMAAGIDVCDIPLTPEKLFVRRKGESSDEN